MSQSVKKLQVLQTMWSYRWRRVYGSGATSAEGVFASVPKSLVSSSIRAKISPTPRRNPECLIVVACINAETSGGSAYMSEAGSLELVTPTVVGKPRQKFFGEV